MFQNHEFILKVGQHCSDTLVILDGQVSVLGLNDRETIGVLTSGSHYSNSLACDKAQLSPTKLIGKQRSIVTMNHLDDNFESKSLVHLVAQSFVVVGVIKQADLEHLYHAYPQWQTMMQTLNRFFFEICKISAEKYC